MNPANGDGTSVEHLRIVSAEVTAGPGPLPHGIFEQSPRVLAVLEDGRRIELFSFYAHERSFVAADFVGRAVDYGRALKFAKHARISKAGNGS